MIKPNKNTVYTLFLSTRKMARDMGVKIVISADAHSPDNLDYMRIGIGQARRGWLEAKDVLNTCA